MIDTLLFKSHFIPAAKSSDKLMIVLHGKGDSINPFKDFNKELDLPDMNFLLLNAPKKFLDGYSWYGDPPYQRTGVLKVRKKMFLLLDELQSIGWKAENIYLFGFSQGCLVSTDLALHYPKKLGGLVGISGYFNFEPRWRKSIATPALKTPWLLTHGAKDKILPLPDTKYGVEKLRQIGLKIDWVESEKEHTFEDDDAKTVRRWLKSKIKYRHGSRRSIS
jgi:phospholipase/carboxylesterase